MRNIELNQNSGSKTKRTENFELKAMQKSGKHKKQSTRNMGSIRSKYETVLVSISFASKRNNYLRETAQPNPTLHTPSIQDNKGKRGFCPRIFHLRDPHTQISSCDLHT